MSKKYEYTTVYIEYDNMDTVIGVLNEWGENGWQVVHIRPLDDPHGPRYRIIMMAEKS